MRFFTLRPECTVKYSMLLPVPPASAGDTSYTRDLSTGPLPLCLALFCTLENVCEMREEKGAIGSSEGLRCVSYSGLVESLLCDLCAPGVKRMILVENEETARI